MSCVILSPTQVRFRSHRSPPVTLEFLCPCANSWNFFPAFPLSMGFPCMSTLPPLCKVILTSQPSCPASVEFLSSTLGRWHLHPSWSVLQQSVAEQIFSPPYWAKGADVCVKPADTFTSGVQQIPSKLLLGLGFKCMTPASCLMETNT